MASSPSIPTDLPAPRDPHEQPHPWEGSHGPEGFDAASHEGLRHALHAVATGGWNSPAGRAVVDALRQRAGSWAFLVDRRCGRPAGATDPADVVAVAWLTLERFASKVAEAQRPWAYLWTAVGNELTRAAVAESQMTDPARVRGSGPGPVAVVRVGLEPSLLDTTLDPRDDGSGPAGEQAPPSDAVIELARRLSVGPREMGFWLDAIGRALDVMADARHSYEECTLRRDPYMRHVLGLTLDELSALAALLIGPRKGDRAAHSLLLALHRDLAVSTDAVVGAAARIRLLGARSHDVATRLTAA